MIFAELIIRCFLMGKQVLITHGKMGGFYSEWQIMQAMQKEVIKMYAEKLKHFENVKNLGGKAWEHAKACDLIDGAGIDDCSMHCFHFQQMFELLFKHLLEVKSKYGAYPLIHKLDKLFSQVIELTGFDGNAEKYSDTLNALTVCAEAYHYNFLLDCTTYQRSVGILNPLLDQLAQFSKPHKE